MKGSEIKIKRRDLMSPGSVAAMLRRMADQIETDRTFSLDGLPIALGNLLSVRQEYKKERREHTYVLKVVWEEELADQPKLDDEPDEDDLEDRPHLPEPGVPTTPLEMPGFEHRARPRS